MKKIFLSGAAFMALPLFGCASYPAPTEHLANSYANIRAAQEVGALNSPQAALHLKLAQEEQTKAKALVDDSKNEEADFMTMRANSDAELAIALTRETSARGKAGQASAEATAAAIDGQTPAAPTSFSATTTTTSTTIPSTGPSK
jgi:hypothetical protein